MTGANSNVTNLLRGGSGGDNNVTGPSAGLPGSNATANNILSALGLTNVTSNCASGTGNGPANDANGSLVEGSTSITSTPFSFDSNGTNASLQPGDQVSQNAPSPLKPALLTFVLPLASTLDADAIALYSFPLTFSFARSGPFPYIPTIKSRLKVRLQRFFELIQV